LSLNSKHYNNLKSVLSSIKAENENISKEDIENISLLLNNFLQIIRSIFELVQTKKDAPKKKTQRKRGRG